MRSALFALAWAFILAVAAYDVDFAWRYRHFFDTWEMNPLARRVAHFYGFAALFGLKAGLVCFAAGVAAYCRRSHHWLTAPYTGVIFVIHFLLSMQYAFA